MSSIQVFESRVRARLDEARAARERFLDLPEGTAFGEVVAAFDAIGWPLDQVGGLVSLYSAVHPAQELRDAAEGLERELSTFQTELSLLRPAFERLAALDPQQAPNPAARRFLEHALRDYRRSGVDRDPALLGRVRELQQELVRIGQEFERNIVMDVRRVELAEGEAALEGLPEDYRRSHPPGPNGAVTISTDPADFLPFMTFARRGDLRRRLYLEHSQRAWPRNGEVLSELLARRHELVQLLGYPDWATYVTEDKMVRSATAALAFVERVAELARPRMRAEYAELLQHKRAEEPGAEAVFEWERLYWVERVKRAKHHFDSQEARAYFPYEATFAGVLETSAQLFGVQFRALPGGPAGEGLWHDSVRCYDVLEGGALVARAYFDMHPRPGKYKHAALFQLRNGIGGALPAACLVCNFNAPTAEDPGLLLHDQVTTLFHEVGHMLHHLFAAHSPYLRFAGISTEWDFVEVPSQMYEEWAWDHGVLQRFARHHATGEPIPAELVARMRAADEYGKGIDVAQQMFFAAYSLALHAGDPRGVDPTALAFELKRRHLPFALEQQSRFQASFGHLHGYSAIYYTYMWSLVIAKDLFGRFGSDLLDPAMAGEYRRKVLARGGLEDAHELVRSFLGRDYEFAAYQQWLER